MARCGIASFIVFIVLGTLASSHARSASRRIRRGQRQPQFEEYLDAEHVTEVPLEAYAWRAVEQSMEGILEASMGPEVAYWKRRGPSCHDVAHTARSLHDIFLHSVRVVLIRNQTWHFFHPAAAPGSNASSAGGAPKTRTGDGGGGADSGRSRFDWPLLAADPPNTCSSPCQMQLLNIHKSIAAASRAWNPAAPNASLRYQLPDMIFVINAADNMQRFGANSRAPVLSLLKWWQVPWWTSAGNGTGTGANTSTNAGARSKGPSLGRTQRGTLLRPVDYPPGLTAAVASALRSCNNTGRYRSGRSCSRNTSNSGGRTRRGSGGGGGTKGSRGGTGGVRSLLHGSRSGSGGGGGVSGSSADPLWDMVRHFVAARSLDLPPGVRPPQPSVTTPPSSAAGPARSVPPHGGPREPYDMDLLLPTMAYAPRSLSFFPWELKKDIAFFSGVCFCPLYTDLHPICPRALLANASAAGRYPADLDVRLVRRWRGRLGSQGAYRRSVIIRKSRATLPRDHSRYRYVLHMDGLSGSTRMGMLMATDSVILKSRSPYIEYYSRLQVPGSHYLEFWKDPTDPLDVLRTLAEARAATAADPEGRRAAVRANQAIAARYISWTSKLVYARAVLLAYHALISNMDECVRDFVLHLERSGTPLPDLSKAGAPVTGRD